MSIPPILQKRQIIRDLITNLEYEIYGSLTLDRMSGKMEIRMRTPYLYQYPKCEHLVVKYDPMMNSLFIEDPEFEVRYPNRPVGIDREYERWLKLKQVDKYLDEAYYFQMSLIYDLKFTPEDIIELMGWYKQIRYGEYYASKFNTYGVYRNVNQLRNIQLHGETALRDWSQYR